MKNITDKILVIDFGSQVTQLIARRIREHGVYSEIHSFQNVNKEFVESFAPKGIILSGGPSSVLDSDSPSIFPEIFAIDIPVLGICYGQQLMCHLLGGKVEKSLNDREFGRTSINIQANSKLLNGVWQAGESHNVWMSHGDKVVDLPEGFKTIAVTDSTPYAIIACEEKKIYGVQFHPEVSHTENGSDLLKNFTHNIAGCQGNWTMSSFLERKTAEIKTQVGDQRILCAVSGGVDSSVVAALLHQAIGDQLSCIFVDTGLLRKNECEQVLQTFRDLNIPLIHRDASSLFLSKLQGVSDPERKRKIIGATFIDVFEEEASKLGGADFLAQGTLYSDVVESANTKGGASETIKSHHNVGGLPERMRMSLIEPLREIFKDEVRALGRTLGLPTHIVDRHPFPGPGLAIRIPGEITKEKIEILQAADKIYIEEIRNHGLYDQIWQAFAVLLPVKTVGVMGDGRSYEYVCALRAVTSFDGMTADFYDFSHDFLRTVSNKIVNSVQGINRIVYDVTSKPPGTIEWE
jgi:GMP synthase (glutamine-hydrolysing)